MLIKLSLEKMQCRRALTWISMFLIILMVVSALFLQYSPTRFQAGTTMAENRATETQEIQSNQVGRLENGTSADFIVEDSAREVPTGPDPLHHNENPTGP